MRTIDDLIARLRAEYLEMPGLQLTAQQVQRLCGIERTICALVLGSLVESRFLALTSEGHYTRTTDGPMPQRARRDWRVDVRAKMAS
jgi:hypothetical protein